jgi:hypothetical protein
MNSSGIIPPREGVENLAAARNALAGGDISSSHIKDAIISAHSALEVLFRQYLSQEKFVPIEARHSADDHICLSAVSKAVAMQTTKVDMVRQAVAVVRRPHAKNPRRRIPKQYPKGLEISTLSSKACEYWTNKAF